MNIRSDVIQIVKSGPLYCVTLSHDGMTSSLGSHDTLQEAVERPLPQPTLPDHHRHYRQSRH